MEALDFFYFFGSGYAYLSVMRIEELARQSGVTVKWRPFNVRPLMAENNVLLRSERSKVKYLWRDIERRASLHDVPFLNPPIWPTDPNLLANRVGVVASEEGWLRDYTIASFKAWYLEGSALGSPDCLVDIISRLGRDAGAVLARADTAEIVAKFEEETDVARKLGIFGSPSFVVAGELFWGDDRLEEAIAWACNKHPLQVTPKAYVFEHSSVSNGGSRTGGSYRKQTVEAQSRVKS
jgi:2-hydroxychromene-2-carboxylate isomerase